MVRVLTRMSVLRALTRMVSSGTGHTDKMLSLKCAKKKQKKCEKVWAAEALECLWKAKALIAAVCKRETMKVSVISYCIINCTFGIP